MPKVLVETTASFMLVDPMTGDEIAFNRPSVVEWSSFADARLAAKQIRLLASDLKDETTDADFVAVLEACDGNQEMAVDAFVSEFQNPAVEQGTKDEPPVVIVDQLKNPITKK